MASQQPQRQRSMAAFQSCSQFYAIDSHIWVINGDCINYRTLGRDEASNSRTMPSTFSMQRTAAAEQVAVTNSPAPWIYTSASFGEVRLALGCISEVIRFSQIKGLYSHTRELAEVVVLAEKAYKACRGIDIASLVQRGIKECISGLAQCLPGIFSELMHIAFLSDGANLQSSPLGDIVQRWWNSNQKEEEISTLREKVQKHLENLCGCLYSLKSFHWLKWVMFLSLEDGSHFNPEILFRFLESRTPSPRHLRIDEVLIMEPLAGRPLSVPTRFVSSFEDLHLVLQQGCRGTLTSRYIECNEYQLDESSTNLTLDSTCFQQLFKPGKQFEVSIRVVTHGTRLSECPRCGHDNGYLDGRRVDGWVRCGSCLAQFNAVEYQYPSIPTPEDDDVGITAEGQHTEAASTRHDAQADSSSSAPEHNTTPRQAGGHPEARSPLSAPTFQQASPNEVILSNPVEQDRSLTISIPSSPEVLPPLSPDLEYEFVRLGDVSPSSSQPKPLATSGRKGTQFSQDDIIVVLMGPTGSGKSTFINCAMRSRVARVTHSVQSCTEKIHVYGCHHPTKQDRRVFFIDTPGFEGTAMNDRKTLKSIAKWLKNMYGTGVRLSGILLFHMMTEARWNGTKDHNLEVFQEMCGPKALKNVVVVSTGWEELEEDVGSIREQYLVDKVLAESISQGCRYERFSTQDFDAAWDIINLFRCKGRALLIQEEMAKWRMPLKMTSAFKALARFGRMGK
ncbi:TKL/TKL-ccin protein kinase [Coprinopsis cinerea AmutBmut pab1-1]|nr:TKL/TKL-ccin protein kinase [Coprinopsis cinerea AmutBmut pab1-1]